MDLEKVAFKHYRYVNLEPQSPYDDPFLTKLSDGKKEFNWPDLVGWDGCREEVEIELDLKKTRLDITSIVVYAVISKAASVGLPDGIEVLISEDGKTYRNLGEAVREPYQVTDNRAFAYRMDLNLLPLHYIYLKIKPNPNIGWFMISEVEILASKTKRYDSNNPPAIVALPKVVNLSGDCAQLTFSTLNEVCCRYILLKEGSELTEIKTDEKSLNHQLVLTDLEPNCTYELKVLIRDAMEKVAFTTAKLKLLRGPILGALGNNRIQVSFECNAFALGLVEYWPLANKSDIYTLPVIAQKCALDTHYKAVFPQLKAGEYGYRLKLKVQNDTVLVSDNYRFKAFNNLEIENFTFLVYGDTQHAEQILVANEMLKVNDFDFILHLGDLVNQPGNTLDWEDLFKYSGPLMARAPFFPTLGNHDDHHYKYYQCFDYLEHKNNYSFLYGPFQFISFDSSSERDLSLAQLQWLEAELKDSNKPYKIIFTHCPLFMSWYDDNASKDLRDKIASILEKYQVKVVFSGHAHVYDHIEKEKVHYVVSGGGGGYQIARSKSPFMAPLHFLKVDVKAHNLTVTAIKPGGEIVDSFTVKLN